MNCAECFGSKRYKEYDYKCIVKNYIMEEGDANVEWDEYSDYSCYFYNDKSLKSFKQNIKNIKKSPSKCLNFNNITHIPFGLSERGETFECEDMYIRDFIDYLDFKELDEKDKDEKVKYFLLEDNDSIVIETENDGEFYAELPLVDDILKLRLISYEAY